MERREQANPAKRVFRKKGGGERGRTLPRRKVGGVQKVKWKPPDQAGQVTEEGGKRNQGNSSKVGKKVH